MRAVARLVAAAEAKPGVFARHRRAGLTMDPRIPEILDFWFGPELDEPAALKARNAMWFGSDPAVDRAVAERFGHLPDAALAGALDRWADRPEGALAEVLVLDQFPRNLARGEPRAFSGDSKALAVALNALDAGFDARLHPVQACFLYLPLEHAEDLALQEQCLDLFQRLTARAPPGLEQRFQSFVDFARRHRDIVARFGRFPHRNALLGRHSTPEEAAYLAGGGETFGSKPAGY